MPTTPAGQRLRLYDTDDLNGVMQTMARHAATLLPASQAALIGIQRRGEPLARLLQQHLSQQTGQPEMPLYPLKVKRYADATCLLMKQSFASRSCVWCGPLTAHLCAAKPKNEALSMTASEEP